MKLTVVMAILMLITALSAGGGLDDIQRLYGKDMPSVYSDALFQVTQDTLKQYTDTLKAIYESRLKTHPDLECRLVFKFRIDSSGHISEISLISGSTDDSLFKSQVQERVRKIVFTEGLPVVIEWPLVFSK